MWRSRVYAWGVVQASAVGVERTLRELAQRLEDEIDELVETMLPRMRAEVPEYDIGSRPELRDAERASIYGNIRAVLGALDGDRTLPDAPTEAMEEARVTARAGVPLESLLHTYRVGHAVIWERALDITEELAPAGSSRLAVLKIGSRWLFSYVDAIASHVTMEYTRERDRILRSSIERRVQLVRDILDGATIDAGELGYDLDAEHLALVVQGPGAEAWIDELTSRLQRHPLTIAVSDQVVWAWLGARREFGTEGWRLMAGVSVPEGTRAAVGEPRRAAEGFRRSHIEALAAHEVGRRLHAPIIRYDDVTLEAALLADEQVARRLVDHELGPLAEDDGRAAKLRTTLDAYLRTGQNASAAAAMLKVTDRTVAYRIRAIEDLLGRSVAARSPELATALRLRPLRVSTRAR
jgi:PucR C-terminal helix-turn-helix domain/GGDEF-like domain